jgi:cell division protein FtsB
VKATAQLFNLLRSVAGRALAIAIIGVFASYALFGNNGVLAWGDYSQRLSEKRQELALLKQEKAQLANRVALLHPRNANPDMVDELVRRDLGLAQADEVIIPLD